MSWKDSIVEWFDGFGSISLAAMSFTEAIIQPVPPDLLFLPMLVNADGDSSLVMWLWIVITVSSVAGSLVGYYLGKKWGRGLFTRFNANKHLEKIEALTLRYGTLGVFIAAFSPIPYKVFGWAAGMGEMNPALPETGSDVVTYMTNKAEGEETDPEDPLGCFTDSDVMSVKDGHEDKQDHFAGDQPAGSYRVHR